MIRFVALAIGIALLSLLLLKLAEALRKASFDWGGVCFALVFVGLAFYLRHATGLG